MKTMRIYAMFALLLMGGVRLQAQVNEPVEILQSPNILLTTFVSGTMDLSCSMQT